jgi:hypothetical protein
MKKPKNLNDLSIEEQLDWYKQSHIKLEQQLHLNQKSYLPDLKKLFDNLYNIIIDPNNNYYSYTKDKILKDLENIMGNKVAVLYNEETIPKDREFDIVLEQFAIGTSGYLSNWDLEKDTTVPLVIRGVGATSQLAIKHCWENNRPFYAIDTGYFGNKKHKMWHRITKNNLQLLGPVVSRPDNRLKKIGYHYKKFTDGKKILICPPSEKIMMLFNQPTPELWVEQTIAELSKYTDRPIEVRLKPSREQRTTTNTIESALSNDVYCLITYNSIAAIEALMYGKPAITLGPNAAQLICNTNLNEIENLNKPSKDEMYDFMCYLSYGQFTRAEMQNGYAWEILNESC